MLDHHTLHQNVWLKNTYISYSGIICSSIIIEGYIDKKRTVSGGRDRNTQSTVKQMDVYMRVNFFCFTSSDSSI